MAGTTISRFPGVVAIGTAPEIALTGDGHNINIAGYSHVRINCGLGSFDITGFAGGTPEQILIVCNIGLGTVRLVAGSALSLPANRLAGSAAFLAMPPGSQRFIYYDPVDLIWRMG